MKRKYRNQLPPFKLKVLSAIKGDQLLAELSERFDVRPHKIQNWKKQLLNQKFLY